MQVKVWLLGISPMVWRRVLVPSACTLGEPHGVVQVAMGWEGIHLYQFCLRAARCGSWEPSASSPEVALAALRLRKGARFTYEYGLSIPWRHEVRIENQLGPEAGRTCSVRTGGNGACPPEHCDGPAGFMAGRNRALPLDAREDLDTMTEIIGGRLGVVPDGGGAPLGPYAAATGLLADVLPVASGANRTAVREHALRMAERAEAELGDERPCFIGGCPAEWEALPIPEGRVVAALDSGYVRNWDDRTSNFELIVGRSVPEDRALRYLGLMHGYDQKPKRRLFEVLKSQELQANQDVIFLTGGGEEVRALTELVTPKAGHVSDWFHITMRLTVLSQYARSAEHHDQAEGARLLALLDSIKWLLWHGNQHRAGEKIAFFEDDVDDLELSYPNPDARRHALALVRAMVSGTGQRQWRRRCSRARGVNATDILMLSKPSPSSEKRPTRTGQRYPRTGHRPYALHSGLSCAGGCRLGVAYPPWIAKVAGRHLGQRLLKQPAAAPCPADAGHTSTRKRPARRSARS